MGNDCLDPAFKKISPDKYIFQESIHSFCYNVFPPFFVLIEV